MIKTSLFLLSALFSQSLFAAPVVDAFLTDPITVLDEQGKSQREVARSGLPKTLPILQYNKDLDLVEVELAGQKVWLDTMDVRVSPPLNVVKLPCQKLSSSQADDHQNNSTIGFGAGCSK